MWVTIYTDASIEFLEGGHSDTPRQASGAAWLKCDLGRELWGMAYPAHSPDEAEAIAIHKAVLVALNHWPGLEAILVKSDSKNCINYLRDRSGYAMKDTHTIRWLNSTLRTLNNRGIKLRTMWVKGHRNPSSGKPQWLNAWCDAFAGHIRRKIVDKPSIYRPSRQEIAAIGRNLKL